MPRLPFKLRCAIEDVKDALLWGLSRVLLVLWVPLFLIAWGAFLTVLAAGLAIALDLQAP